MKTIIKLMVLCFSVSTTVAQEIIVPIEDRKDFEDDVNKTYYYKDVNNELNKFLGTWRYEDGNTSFEITFIKDENRNNGFGGHEDEIKPSAFKFIKNGITVYDSANYDDTNYEEEYFNGGFFTYPEDLNILELMYNEPDVSIDEKVGDLKLIYNNLGGTETLTWGVRFISNNDGSNPFKMPMLMTLIKQ